MAVPEQLTLALAHRPAQGRGDFLVSPSNEAAFAAVTLPTLRFALSGPSDCGKTHLASVWGELTNAMRIAAEDLTEARAERLLGAPAVVVEDVDVITGLPVAARRQVETLLFHVLNFTSAEQQPLLLTGRAPPARWEVLIPDLASRLAALPHVPIAPPDDILLSSILSKLLKDRQLTANEDVIPYLIRRMERSFAAAERMIAALDRMALAEKRPITRPLARRLFDHDEDVHGADTSPETGEA